MGSRSCPERSAWKAIEVVDQLDQLDQLGPARENQLVQAIREWLRVVVCAGPAGPAKRHSTRFLFGDRFSKRRFQIWERFEGKELVQLVQAYLSRLIASIIRLDQLF